MDFVPVVDAIAVGVGAARVGVEDLDFLPVCEAVAVRVAGAVTEVANVSECERRKVGGDGGEGNAASC